MSRAENEYHFVYDTGWRAVMTRRYTDTAASIPAYKDRIVYNNAGLGGYGGSGYTDAVLMRDADLTTGWSGAADGTLEDRQYQCNNWRGDVVAILDDAGQMIEQVRYTPYGVPFALPAGDSDSDGDWDGTDYSAIGGSYDIREDADLDGATDFFDITHALNRAGASYQTLGWKVLSSDYCANRKGYASYEHDAAAPATLAHVRYRVYNFTLGRWTQRDPAGYTDGPNRYGYVGARAVASKDPMGLKACGVTVGDSGCGGKAPCWERESALVPCIECCLADPALQAPCIDMCKAKFGSAPPPNPGWKPDMGIIPIPDPYEGMTECQRTCAIENDKCKSLRYDALLQCLEEVRKCKGDCWDRCEGSTTTLECDAKCIWCDLVWQHVIQACYSLYNLGKLGCEAKYTFCLDGCFYAGEPWILD